MILNHPVGEGALRGRAQAVEIFAIIVAQEEMEFLVFQNRDVICVEVERVWDGGVEACKDLFAIQRGRHLTAEGVNDLKTVYLSARGFMGADGRFVQDDRNGWDGKMVGPI